MNIKEELKRMTYTYEDVKLYESLARTEGWSLASLFYLVVTILLIIF